MPKDIVDLDTQNHLTVPATDIKPYPLSQNDKPVDASKVEVPTQEPVVVDDITPASDMLSAVNNQIQSGASIEQNPEEFELKQQKPVLNEQNQPEIEQKVETRDETPEEQYKRSLGQLAAKHGYTYYVPETNSNIVSNTEDYEKAKFSYLSFKMKQHYLHNVHNYADYKEPLEPKFRNELKTVAKSLGGRATDMATGTAALAVSAGAFITGAARRAEQDFQKRTKDMFSFSLSMNNRLNPSEEMDRCSLILSDNSVEELRNAGASEQDIKTFLKQKYPTAEKYQISPTLQKKTDEFTKALLNLEEPEKASLEIAKKAYGDFRKLNNVIKETVGLNMDEYDNPTAVYWGSITSSTLLCAAGLLSGGMGWLMPVGYAAMEWDEAIQEGLEQGKSLDEAMLKSYAVAGVSLITEKLQLNSILRRYPSFRSLMWKGLGKWTAENVGQEIAQDLSIMGSKQVLGLAQYTAQEYLMTIPETGIAALVSSVPMGVILQHRKVGLAKRFHAMGMKEENAVKFADYILEEGMNALKENPMLMRDYVNAFQDVFQTTKVQIARNALEQGQKEAQDNKKAVNAAYTIANQRQAAGENVVVLEQKAPVLAEQLTGFHSTPEDVEQFDSTKRGTGEGTNAWGAGAYFLLDKNHNIKQYGGKALKQVGRSGKAFVITAKLPDTKFLMEANKPLEQQNEYIKKQLKTVLDGLHKQGIIESNYERMKVLPAMDVYEKVANQLSQESKAYDKMSKLLADNGIKGLMYEGEADGKGVVVYDEEKDVQIISREELPSGRQEVANKIKQMSEDELNNMSLEEFLKKSNMKDWFDSDLSKKILNPDKVIKHITSVLTNTGLFSPEEAQIAARQFAMLSYVQMAMTGHNEVKDFIDTFPQIVNAFMYSAFGIRGEYQEVFDRIPDGNILKRKNALFKEQVNSNPALKKKLFGNKTPTEKDLQEVSRMFKMILDKKPYQGTKGSDNERWYNILKEALVQKVSDDTRDIDVGNILKPIISFEARLQKNTSYVNGDDTFVNQRIVNSNYGIVDNEKLEDHYMDLAIIRVLGLWGTTANFNKEIESDGKSFWNKNRNKTDILRRFINEDVDRLSVDVNAVFNYWNRQKDIPSIGKGEFAKMVEEGLAVELFDNLMLSKNAGGILDTTGNIDIMAISTRGRASTPQHEFGHEIFMIVVRTLQEFRKYKPQKAQRIYNAFMKVYEAKYKEKLSGEMTPLQYKRLHELFAELYAKSVVTGLAVEGGSKDLNDLLSAAARVNRIIRNPAVPVSFIAEDESVQYTDEYDRALWQNVWNELNKKEDYATMLEARNALIDGVKTGKNEQQLYYEIENYVVNMPNSNTKLQLASVLKKLDGKITPLDAHNLNNILVKAAVQDMFGVQLVNQNLIDQMDSDPVVYTAASMGRFFAMTKGAFRRYIPEKVQNFFNKVYVEGIKTWEKVETNVKEMVEKDGYVKSAVDFVRKAMQPLSTTAKKLDKRFYFRLSYAIFQENQLKTALNATYTKVYDVYAKMTPEQKQAFDNDLHDQNWLEAAAKFDDAGGQYDTIMDLKKDIESMYELYERMDPNGDGVGIIEGYFPRSIKDLDGMIDYMMTKEEYRSMAEEMMETRDINEAISTYTLSTYGKGYEAQIKGQGNIKKRFFKNVPQDLRQFYKTPLEALQKYYDDVATAYGRYSFLGVAANLKLQNESFEQTAKLLVGDEIRELSFKVYTPTKNWKPALEKLGFLAKEDTEAGREHNKKLMEVLEGTFYRGTPHPGLTIFRTINNIATINNLFSAMSNLIDFAITTYRYGFMNTLMGAQDVFQKTNVAEYNELMTDLYKEFDMDSYNLNRWYNKVFKWSGFSLMDIFGKQASINAAFYSAKQKLLNNDQGVIDKIYKTFGEDQNLSSAVISDIMNDNITDDVKFFLFNELSGQQPLTLLDVPYYYNRYPYMRIFYQFRTFALRQLDFFKNEVLMPKLKKDPVGALKDVACFMALLLAFGIPKEAIKALLLGQQFDISDEAVSQILALGMLNKYSYYEAKKGNLLNAFAYATIIPPVPVVTRVVNDAKNLTIGRKVGKRGRYRIPLKDIQSIKNLPVGGEWFYWWFGGGSDQHFDVRM